jgi:hypothetical protein
VPKAIEAVWKIRVPTAHLLNQQTVSQTRSDERAGNRVRTDDLLITNQLLYQLSYAGLMK